MNFKHFCQLFFCLYSCTLNAGNVLSCSHPFYVGITAGYGLTTWENLVPNDLNEALSTSVPISVSQGNKVWGVTGGYTIIPNFAVELSYMRYPVAKLYFDEFSMFAINNGRLEISTQSSRIALTGKFLLPIPCTAWKAFSNVGVAEVFRDDAFVRRWRLSPAFGAGFDYDISPQWFAELGTEYIAGYGQSELNPVNHYIPFLYSAFLKLAYKF